MAGIAISKNTVTPFTEGYLAGEDLINRPDIWHKVFPYLKEEVNMVDMLVATGRKEQTIQSDFYWHEEDILIPMAQIATGGVAGTSAAGNPVTITINPVSADFEVPFKKWDTLKVGAIRGIIRQDSDIIVDGSGSHEFTIWPVKTTDNIVAAAAAGQWVVWFGAAKSDGQNQPASMISKPQSFSGKTQIIPTNYTTHGSVAGNKAYITTKSGNEYYYYRGVEQAIVRHKIAIALTMLMGEASSGLVDPGNPDNATIPIRTTQGIELRMFNHGNPKSAAAFDFSEFESISNTLDANFAPDQMMGLCGNLFINVWDNIMLDRNYYETTPNYSMFHNQILQGGAPKWGDGDPKQRALDLGFSSIVKSNRTYHVKKEKTLYYPNVTGATGQPYPNMALFLPMEQVKDSQTGDYYNSFALRYKASDMENRFMQEWVRDKKSDDYDKFRFNHLSEVGLQLAMMRKSVIWQTT